MNWKRWVVLLGVMTLVAAACAGEEAATTVATTQPPAATPAPTEAPPPETTEAPAAEPIIIGSAMDMTGDMSPFSLPANTAAGIMIERINEAGGAMGRPLQMITLDATTDPDQAKAAAIELIEAGAQMILVTCDFDLALPASQEAVNAGVLAVAPCIGTDRQGPKGLGEAGSIAFSFGNLAQDEGALQAEFAVDMGWENAVIVKDNLLVYFRNVVDAFDVRYTELGGTVVGREEFTGFDGTIGAVVSAVAAIDDKDVIAITTAFADLPAFVAGLRGLGDETPILCSWACDGTFWVPEGVSNLYYNTAASVFGDDPSQEVNDFIAAMEATGAPPATGGFIGGAQAIQAFAEGVETTGGTDAEAIAAFFETFDDKELIFGEVSFSEELHTPFGRPYRVMLFTDSVPALVEVRTATSPAVIPG